MPAAFEELNRAAFDAGFDYGLKHLETGAIELGEEYAAFGFRVAAQAY